MLFVQKHCSVHWFSTQQYSRKIILFISLSRVSSFFLSAAWYSIKLVCQTLLISSYGCLDGFQYFCVTNNVVIFYLECTNFGTSEEIPVG